MNLGWTVLPEVDKIHFNFTDKPSCILRPNKRVGLIESLAWSCYKFDTRLNIDVEPIVKK